MEQDLADIAYDAYCTESDGKSLVTGEPLPDFPDLPDAIKVAWNEAAQAVVQAVMPFRFDICQEVSLKHSTETGEVIGRAHYDNSEPTYLVRYRAADGCQRESWWAESAIK